MGKSPGGAVWLNAEMLSPYEFWQFWRNTTDADVGRFLKLYTELPVDECDRLGALGGAEINAAKVTLANEVTALCHGAEAAAAAEATAREVFEQGGVGEALETVTLSAADLGAGLASTHFLVATGAGEVGQGGQAADRREGPALQQRAGLRPQRAGHRRDGRPAASRSRSARSATPSCSSRRDRLIRRQRGRAASRGCNSASRASIRS